MVQITPWRYTVRMKMLQPGKSWQEQIVRAVLPATSPDFYGIDTVKEFEGTL